MDLQEKFDLLEEKIDEILKYQRRQQLFMWIRWGFWLLLFIIFVVFPVFFAYDLITNPEEYFDISLFQSYKVQFEQLMKLLTPNS